ncbi:MAG: DNA repair protein RecO [Casimicrobiaceae bacterium]
MPAQAKRSPPERGYVLHSYPYKETSLIVDVFTVDHGRMAMVAKGAKRPGSALRGALLSLQPLEVAWSGRGEVRTLVQAQWRPGQAWLTGRALMCGMYLNELLLKLLPREDPHPRLFEAYAAALLTLGELSEGSDQNAVLREFEVTLLAELGYGLELSTDVITGENIRADRLYRYDLQRGPSEHGSGELVSGAALLALASGRFDTPGVATEAREFVRRVISSHLERRALRSTDVLADLRALTQRLDSQSPRRHATSRTAPAP